MADQHTTDTAISDALGHIVQLYLVTLFKAQEQQQLG